MRTRSFPFASLRSLRFAVVVTSLVASAVALQSTEAQGQAGTVASKVKHARKKRWTVSPAPPRTRLTLAASTPAPSEPLVDESALPPPRPGTCPGEMADVEQRFCVDKFEASLVEMAGDGERPWSPFEPVDGHVVRAQSVAGVVPQAYVSGAQAAEACARAGKRLCSPVEWRKACVGPEGLKYGYADARERGRCNDAGRSPMAVLFGLSNASPASDWDPLHMNDPRANQVPGTVAKTGAHPGCSNAYGVVDMVGNLHEWVDDPDGTFQGGYYLDTSINGEGCGYRTTAHEFTYHDYSTGFRCCKDPT